MLENIFPSSKSSNPKIKNIYKFIVQNKNKGLDFWEATGGLELHNYLTDLTILDFEELYSDILNWSEIEQNLLTDCIAYGIDGKFISIYDDEKRIVAMRIYSQLPKGFKHPELKKWIKNYKIHSKTQSKNPNILSVYDYILKHEYDDSDFWSIGGGSQEIQNRFNNFKIKDWGDLKSDIFNWKEDQKNTVLESIAFGFDGMFTPYLKEEVIPEAGNFLLDIFSLIDDIDIRYDIAYSSNFINRSNTKQIEKLIFMRNWMLENGFDSKEWIESSINPLRNIEEAIEKASR